MSDPFVAEIRLFAGNFAPRGWAFCNGQILAISQNTALFSLLGTNYGGDGKNTFGLPNLQARVPIGSGQGPGLTDRILGEVGGAAAVTLTEAQMAVHTHTVRASTGAANTGNPTGALLATTTSANPIYVGTPGATLAMNAGAIAGSAQPHNNLQPYVVLSYIIALQGVFPPRG